MNDKNQNRTRIAIFAPSLRAVSGVSTHVNLLLNSKLAQQFELLHFQVGSEGRSEGKLQRLARLAFGPLQLAIFVSRYRPHIVHINTSMDLKAFWRDLSFLVIARSMGCRVLNQIHSGSAPTALFSNPIFLYLLKRFLLSSHAVTVLSSEALGFHKSFDSRIAVELVPNAIDSSSLMGAERPASTAADAPLRLVYVGRIVRSKGLFDVLDALSILKIDGLQFTLQIAGSGPDEGQVKASIARLNLAENVSLLGPVFGAAKTKLWLESNLLVFPTYHDEGLPYSILESMAAGCVPITCRVAAIPDVMKDGVHGLFVPSRDPAALADAIRRLDADRSELQRMSQAGCQRIKDHYTVDRLAERFADIYQRLGS